MTFRILLHLKVSFVSDKKYKRLEKMESEKVDPRPQTEHTVDSDVVEMVN